MNTTSRLFAFSTWLVLGCAVEPPTRWITAEVEPSLPTGGSFVASEQLLVSTVGLEPLSSGWRYVVWARGAGTALALGELSNQGSLAVSWQQLGIPLATVDTLQVTEEPAGSALPASPADLILLHGAPGQPLGYVPVVPTELAGATSAFRIQPAEVLATPSGLPALPDGLTYGVWVALSDAAGNHLAGGANPVKAAHGQMGEEPDSQIADGATAQGGDEELLRMAYLGDLDPSAPTRLGLPEDALPRVHAAMVAVRSAHGATDGVPVAVVLHGAVSLPVPEGQESGHVH